VKVELKGLREVESATNGLVAAALERRSKLLLVAYVDVLDILLRVRTNVKLGGKLKVDAIILDGTVGQTQKEKLYGTALQSRIFLEKKERGPPARGKFVRGVKAEGIYQ
jgi:hypothetical protein